MAAANVYAKSDAYGQDNYSLATYNNNGLQVDRSNPYLRAYIGFDLTPYSDISAATLYLYPAQMWSGKEPYVNKAASEIDPETVMGDVLWDAADGTNIGQTSYASGAYTTTDVSAYAAEEEGGFCGFGLTAFGTGVLEKATFFSSEYADAGKRPYLAIMCGSASAPTAPTDVVAVVTNERDVRVTWSGSACHGHRWKVAYDGGDWEDAVEIADGGAANTATFTPEESWTSLKVAVQSFWYGDLDSAYVESTTITEASFVTVSISATSDAWATSSALTDDGALRTRYPMSAADRRSYIRFDLSSYSGIVDGVIYLYQLDGSPPYLSSLTEPTTKLDPESSSAADVFAAADGDVIGVLPYASSNFSSLNVADHVAAEAGGYCDFGIIPKPQAYSGGTTYASSENANENRRPYLTITYLALVPPAAPSDVAAAIDGDEIAVTWTDNASGETGYKYKVAYDGGEYGEAVIMEDSADAESVSFTPEEGWATVKVAVAAYSDGGDSEYAESALLVKPVPVKTYPAVVGHLWLCSGLRRAVLRSAR